ncbi:AbiV family abortive infection protein [Arthrobacter sp. NPDC093128]|uniref:AbiV family abortive infection protein n=1 Tax=Arthrobacter sp. NPDC093128 TaxID=3154979 RepID=UPI0034313BE0
MELSAKNARELWKALMANAASLVRDAELLLRSESFGRAWSLTVLAQEELRQLDRWESKRTTGKFGK